MSEDNNQEKSKVGKIILAIFIIAIIGLLVFLLINAINNSPAQKATLNDIDGNWTQTATTQSYIFIPKNNIDGLEFTFTLKDKNNQTIDTIIKKVGNVKEGQQYTVTIDLLEVDSLSSFLNISTTLIKVSAGQKKII